MLLENLKYSVSVENIFKIQLCCSSSNFLKCVYFSDVALAAIFKNLSNPVILL
jgi:hypothetical protein